MDVKMSVAYFEKNRNLTAISALIILITGISLVYTNLLYVILYAFIIGCILVTLSFFGFLIYCSEKKPYEKTGQILTEEYEKKIQILHSLIVDSHKIRNVQNDVLMHLPIIYGRTIDSLLEQLIDNILRDFLIVYLKAIDLETDALNVNLREDFWNALVHLNKRLGRIDCIKLLAQDVVTKVTVHFEKMRIAQNRASDANFIPVFFVLPHLKDAKTELDHLRKVANMCIRYLLPKDYYRTPLKLLLREVLATKVFFPAISLLTSPDYINQKIIAYLESRQHEKALRQKTFEYAANFEDFIKIINSTTDDKELRRYRNHIINEIMEATAMQNQQRSKGLDPDSEKTSTNQSKSDINAAKKLKQYISQLTLAKNQCERILEKLGFNTDFQNEDEKIYSLLSILETVCGRKHFSLFLDTVNSSGLLGFYMAVEELRVAPKSSWHQLGVEIYYTYIRSPSAEIKIDKEMRKKIDAFVLGNSGPEILYDLQNTILETLKEKYYSPFLLSPQYSQFKDAIKTDLIVDSSPTNVIVKVEDIDAQNISSEENIEVIHEGFVRLGDHSNYARMKLDQLQEKLDNKTQALQALKSSIKPESKVLSILENEVEWLKSEKRQLEAHLSRTELWGENLGKWRATVQNAEVPDERSPPQFVLVVHVSENTPTNDYEVIEKPSDLIDKRAETEGHSKSDSGQAAFMTARDFLSSRDFITSCVSLISRDKSDNSNKAEAITPSEIINKEEENDKDKATVSENILDKDKFEVIEVDKDFDKVKRDQTTSREIRKRRGDRKRIDSAYEVTGTVNDFGIDETDSTTSQKNSRHEETRGDICTGWVVLRSLTEFQELNRKLRPLCQDLKYVELPSSNAFKLLFGKTDKATLDKAKNQIQEYLKFVLTKEELYQSESLYTFLSPSSEHLKIRDTSSPKKSRFSIATLLKSAGVMNTDNLNSTFSEKRHSFSNCGPSSGSGSAGTEFNQQTEMSHYLDGCDGAGSSNNSNNLNSGYSNSNLNLNFLSIMNNGSCNSLIGDGEKDTIAEPLFTLMSEIFDMKGVFMWLRRSLISFVQVTYGSTINRQVRDMIAYLHSESMLHYYLSSFIKTWWPGGELRVSEETNISQKEHHITTTSPGEETDSKNSSLSSDNVLINTDSQETRKIIAHSLLLDNIPQILFNLLGQRTAKRGVSKIFEILQDERANKQLFYEVLELIIVELFPEIQKQRKIHSTSQEHV